MNLDCRILLPIVFCLIPVFTPVAQAVGQPDLAELTSSPAASSSPAAPPSAAVRFNALNSRVRDGNISREAARTELKRLLAELRSEYYRKGGADYRKDTWVFPLAGHGVRAMGGGRNKGYVAPGYDYFSGNRHGGHPSFDIFINDRNQDSLEDRSGKPVKVLSLTGGIVVALEREWQPGSALRGGKYFWIYDPANDLLIYYAHNSELFVELGDVVKPGDQLAIVGRSGYNAMKRRSPSHLHLTVLHVRDGLPLPVNVLPELVKAAAGVERSGVRNRSGYLLISRKTIPYKESSLAKPNFQFQKRQKELEKAKKQEEKKQRKLEKAREATDGDGEPSAEEEENSI